MLLGASTWISRWAGKEETGSACGGCVEGGKDVTCATVEVAGAKRSTHSGSGAGKEGELVMVVIMGVEELTHSGSGTGKAKREEKWEWSMVEGITLECGSSCCRGGADEEGKEKLA
jgi:hypothetical protein